MPRSLFLLYVVVIFFTFAKAAYGQDQTVNGGQSTTPITFPPGCVFNWTNDSPSIGLAARGTGNIPSFTAINDGNDPTIATITAIPQATASFAYIVDNSKRELSVINLITNTIIAKIPVGTESVGLAVNEVNNRVYVANQQSNSVSVINSLTNTIVTTIDFGIIGEPSGMALSPDGSKLYITDYSQYNNLLRVINTADNSIAASIPIGENSWGIAVSPDGNFVYTASSSDKEIMVIDTRTNSIVATIPDQAPTNICISPDGKYLYVANTFLNYVSVINTQTNMVSATIHTGEGPSCLVLGPDGSRLYVSNSVANTVAVINTSDNSVITTINTGINPGGLCFSSDGSKLYSLTLHVGNDNLSVINTATNTINVINLPIPPSHTFGKFISSSSTCSTTPITYNITVNPLPPPTVTPAGNLTAIETVYGTPSASGSFSISGTNLTTGILVSPPSGFEVSTDGVSFNHTVTVGSTGTLNSATVYVRLSAASHAGNYDGTIVLSAGIVTAGINLPVSTVTPAPLLITADNKIKPLNSENPLLTASFSGFVNDDNASSLTSPPIVTTTAVLTSPLGQYPISAEGAASSDYDISYSSGVLTVLPAHIVIPNTFSPNGDGINDTWAIKYIEYYTACTFNIFNRWGVKVFSSVGYDGQWDGRIKGVDAPAGAYYYVIDLKNNSKTETGWVTILR